MNYFNDPASKHFSFESFAPGLAADTFGVTSFTGYESISKPYDFEIMLVSSNKKINLEDVLQSRVVFTIHRGANDDVTYNGILAKFDQLHEVNDVIFYRARLVPKLWWLTLTHHNQVFLNQSVTSFVEEALRDGGLESADFDIAALTGYDDIDYTCQYDESHFNFVSRWLERQGIYYYFRQEADGEVMVLTDTMFSHDSLIQGAELFYNPASGLEGKHLGEAIGSFTCSQKQLPAKLILKDYNYERPSLDITSSADVDPAGRGVSYSYGEFFATTEEGERLATIRAEELLCTKQEFFGESTVPYMLPGFTFNMNNHYREDFNQEYLILQVTHEGNQSHLMSGGMSTEAGKSKNQAIYRNSFKAIPNDVQYRPERVTEKPKISGTINAHIDSEVDAEYAQIDEQGRYRVRLPFDISNEHMDGKGSAPIRMMQPYAGKNRGMQFPLVKGTEVLLTFIEGNPDRPIIAGAVSNPETQGPVSAENYSESVIQTGGNNKIRFEDKAGSERIVMQSPKSNTWFRIGAPNDPVAIEDIDASEDGVRLQTAGSLAIESGIGCGQYFYSAWPATLDESFPENLKEQIEGVYGDLGADPEAVASTFLESGAHIFVSSMNYIKQQSGDAFDVGSGNAYNFGNGYTENYWEMGHEYNGTFKHDILKASGPSWESIDWSKLKGLSQSDVEIAGSNNGQWSPDSTSAEKTIGDAYEVVIGNSIEVSTGSSLEVKHGGRHIEVEYRDDGSIKSWSKSEAGQTWEKSWSSAGTLLSESHEIVTAASITTSEKKYSLNNGALYSYETSTTAGSATASFAWDAETKAEATVHTSAIAESETYAGAKISNENFLGVAMEIQTCLGGKIEMEFTAAGSLKIENTDVTLSFPGLSNYLKTNVVDVSATNIKTLATQIELQTSKINTLITEVDSSATSIQTRAITLIS